jgi:hypothetical protein
MTMEPRTMELPLWDDLRVTVDLDGTASEWVGGTFGLVVRVATRRGDGALKLPQMAGHAPADRDDVPQLLAQELAQVRALAGSCDGLARVLVLPGDGAVADRTVLVGFSDGAAPRFCRVDRSGGEPVLTPANPALAAALRSRAGVPSAVECTSRGRVERWYAGLPWIVYEWASTSLDQVLSSEDRPPALAVCRSLVAGLSTLHRRGMVHGDVRAEHVLLPASGRPGRTVLTEYAGIGASSPQTGGRVWVLPRPRTAPRFAPEQRRRETSAWRGSVKAELGACDAGLRLVVEGDPTGGAAPGLAERLRAGDRLRLGARLFEVRRAASRGEWAEIECAPWWAEVDGVRLARSRPLHLLPGRLRFAEVQVYEPASEATDLHGVGVIAARLLVRRPICDDSLDQLLAAITGVDGARWSSLADWAARQNRRSPARDSFCREWVAGLARLDGAASLVRALEVGPRAGMLLLWFAIACLRRDRSGHFTAFCLDHAPLAPPGHAAARAATALDRIGTALGDVE